MNEQYFLEKVGINYTEECLSILTPRQRDVVLLRTGVKTGEVLTMQAIADTLGYSRERIRQIYDKAIKILRTGGKKSKYKSCHYKKHQKIILEKKILLALWDKLVMFSPICFDFYGLYLGSLKKLEGLSPIDINALKKLSSYFISRLKRFNYLTVQDLIFDQDFGSWDSNHFLRTEKRKINDAVFDFLSSL